jgi:hypothetical protein
MTNIIPMKFSMIAIPQQGNQHCISICKMKTHHGKLQNDYNIGRRHIENRKRIVHEMLAPGNFFIES